MKKISELLNKYGSDKASAHSYGDFYDSLFSSMPLPIKLLEIGILRGASIRAWKEYGCDITAIDIIPKPADLNIAYIESDVKKVELKDIYDIIIDDGSHYMPEMLYVVKHFPTHLTQRGVLVIEDVNISLKRRLAMRWTLPRGFVISYVDLRKKKNIGNDFLIVIRRKN